MLSNELNWFEDDFSSNSRQKSSDSPKSETVEEIAKSSLDISLLLVNITINVLHGLSEETLQKLRDCYTEMLNEIQECLKDLQGTILSGISDLPYNIPEASDHSLDSYINYVSNIPTSKN